MAFLVLALSMMPCADAATINETNAKVEICNSAEQPDHEENDACSPFCHCACCAGFSINHFITSVSNIHIFSAAHKSTFLPSAIIEVVLPIWQPPRLV